MIGALDAGVRAMMTIEGAADGEVFEIFIERVLLRSWGLEASSSSTTSAPTRRPTCGI
jgi:hypothetical protein